MKLMTLLISLLAVLAALSLAAGCVDAPAVEEDQTPTPAPTQSPTPAQTPTTGASPTQTLPPTRYVEVQINRDPLNTDITVFFRGGVGQEWVSSIDVTVTPEGGTPETASLEPRVGSQVTLPGSRGTDRVEVVVTLRSGESYRIKDEMLKFNPHA
ncbi:MAG: hypothetical protein KO206_08835 [Methanomicrobiaceae archaeon]|uniref:Lipoprotein n=1 Tax=hydrocarbon metagenome TaxID=938273 RepID=A0A0W8FFE6_9ZZZZ|nr:hypothetical protein [Methanomicrobiaceae archaeon]MDD5418426.1 hypothetical protein [Methanomicrobiaceae archaeon]